MPEPKVVKFWQITKGPGKPLAGPFPATALVTELKGLDNPSRRYDTPEGWHLFAKGLSSKTNPHLALFRIRHENLPLVEQGGELSELALVEDQNLAEATHFRFFPRNVVLQLYNNYGPGIQRLAQYLRNKVGLDVGLAPILQQDAAKRLARLKDISQVELAVPVNRAYLLEGSGPDETIDAIREMANKSLSKTVYIKATVWGSKAPNASTKWMNLLKKVISGEMFGAFTKLKVRAYDTQAAARQTIDLIAEQLTLTEQVQLQSVTSRAVKDQSAAAALADAYSSLEAEVKAAVPGFPSEARPLSLDELKEKQDQDE